MGISASELRRILLDHIYELERPLYAHVSVPSPTIPPFVLRIFAPSQVEFVLVNQAGSLQGAWNQATRRRLLHGAKADGEGG